MKRKLLSYVAAPVLMFGFVFLLDQVFNPKSLLAQVRAALVQNVDEPGRNPFLEQRFALGTSYTFTVPAGKRYVVQSYTAECYTNGTAPGDVTVLGQGALGAQMLLSTPAHLGFASSGFAFYRGTSTGPLYAEPGTPLRIEASPVNGNVGTVNSCNFYITGYAIPVS